MLAKPGIDRLWSFLWLSLLLLFVISCAADKPTATPTATAKQTAAAGLPTPTPSHTPGVTLPAATPTNTAAPTGTATSSETASPTQTAIAAVHTATATAEGSTASTPLTPVQTQAIYRHPERPFGLIYLLSETAIVVEPVAEAANQVTFKLTENETSYRLIINSQPAGSSTPLASCCQTAGDLVPMGENEHELYALNQWIRRTYLEYKGRRKAVIYTDANDDSVLSTDASAFSIYLSAADDDDYESVELSPALIKAADNLVGSMWTTIDTMAPAIDPPTPDADEVWSMETFTSPDGRWRAEVVSFAPIEPTAAEAERFPNGKHLQRFTLSNDTTTWLLIEQFEGWGLGVGQYEPLRWTGEALYFTYAPVPDGCGAGVNSNDLWRFTFDTKRVERLMPALLNISALSADGTRWAGSGYNGFQVVDFEQKIITTYALDLKPRAEQMAYVSWSPSGARLLVITATDPCGGPANMQRIFLIDWASASTRLVTTIESRSLFVKEWPDEDRVILGVTGAETERVLDLSAVSGET